jgi:hypothetical protein
MNDIEHVVIRHPNYVAGSKERPEVRVFVNTNRRMPPLREENLAVGQTVWMKWKSGPIVAKSKIRAWHSGQFTASTVEDIRELCKGTNLYDLGDFWRWVRDKGSGYYIVILLSDEEWLEEPIEPVEKSRNAWIYLDSEDKRRAWLEGVPEESEAPRAQYARRKVGGGRTPLSQKLRFMILRRDSFTCQYCGRKAPFVELEVDHRKPYVEVREHREDNLVAACVECNRGKGAMPHIAGDLC